MKANEFVGEFGWEYVINVVKSWNKENPYLVVSVDNCTTIHINDLKRLVESWEWVELCGGIEDAKALATVHNDSALLQAIADVESCM